MCTLMSNDPRSNKADHVLLQNDDTLYPGLDVHNAKMFTMYVMDVRRGTTYSCEKCC